MAAQKKMSNADATRAAKGIAGLAVGLVVLAIVKTVVGSVYTTEANTGEYVCKAALNQQLGFVPSYNFDSENRSYSVNGTHVWVKAFNVNGSNYLARCNHFADSGKTTLTVQHH